MFHVTYILSLCKLMSPLELNQVISMLQNEMTFRSGITPSEHELLMKNKSLNEFNGGFKYKYPFFIQVIKNVRERTGLGLKESKHIVDAYIRAVEMI